MDYFDQQNQKFYDFLDETFDLKKAKKWDDISNTITEFKMKRTYRVFAQLFPRKFDYSTELEKSNDSFKTVHYATLKASNIINEIVRFSLYSDQILVFHPLQNPAVTNPVMNPGRNPLRWLPDFLDSLYFYIVIRKWVKAGIVKLIVNPYEYNLDIRDSIDKEVKARFENLDMDLLFEKNKGIMQDHMAEQLAVAYQNKSFEFTYNSLLEMKNPKFSESEAEDFAKSILAAVPRINPLYKGLRVNQSRDVIAPTKGGGPLESILFVSKITKATIYTPDEGKFDQMKQFGKDDFWIKLNHLYSKIPLNFLNNVDTDFALNIRKEDRLTGVRVELKNIFSELNQTSIENFSEDKFKYLYEGFLHEVKKAESEWSIIKKEGETARKYWIGANALLPTVTTNEMHILPLALASGLAIANSFRTQKQKQILQRAQNPISVYVDLKNKQQGFFSQIKNCIL